MKCCARNSTTCKRNGLQIGNGGKNTCPSDLNVDLFNDCFSLLRSKLISSGPSGTFCSCPQHVVIPELVDLNDNSINFKRELTSNGFNMISESKDFIDIFTHLKMFVVSNRKA